MIEKCTITGCVIMTNISDLHYESKLLPMKAHNEILAQQILVDSHQSHRAGPHTTNNETLRPMKPILEGKHGKI